MRRLLLAFLICTLLFGGCATTKYQEFVGSEVHKGTGGTRRIVDGIEIWENGTPPRKYKIVGVIDDKRGTGLISRLSKDKSIAATAKKYGGDAILFMEEKSERRGFFHNMNSTTTHYTNTSETHGSGYSRTNTKKLSKWAVIKYVD